MANCELLEVILRHVFGPAAYLRVGTSTMREIRECLFTMKLHDIAVGSGTSRGRVVQTRDGVVIALGDTRGYTLLIDEVMDMVRYGRADMTHGDGAFEAARAEDPVLADGAEEWPLKRWRIVALLKQMVVLPRQPVYVPHDAVACDLRDSFAKLWAAFAADRDVMCGVTEAMHILRGRETCGQDARKVERKLRRRNTVITSTRELRGVCFIVSRLSGSDATAEFGAYTRTRTCRAVTVLLTTLALSKADCVYKALAVDTRLLAEFGRASGLEYNGPYILDGLHRDIVDILFRDVCGVAVHALPTVQWGHLEKLPEGYAYNTATEYVAAAYDSFAADASENVFISADAVSRHVSGDSYWLAPWAVQNCAIVFDRETRCRAILDYRHQNGRTGGNSTWAAIGGEVYVITRIGRAGEVLGNNIGDVRDYCDGVNSALEGVPTAYPWTYRCCRSYTDLVGCCTLKPVQVAGFVYNALNAGHLTGLTGSEAHVTCCAPPNIKSSRGGFDARGVAGELVARGVSIAPPGYAWTSSTTLSLLQPLTGVATDSIKVRRCGRLAHFHSRLTEPGTAIVGLKASTTVPTPPCVCAGMVDGRLRTQEAEPVVAGLLSSSGHERCDGDGCHLGTPRGAAATRRGWADYVRLLRGVGQLEPKYAVGDGVDVTVRDAVGSGVYMLLIFKPP